MIYLGLGALSFLGGLAFDLATLAGWRRVQVALALVTAGLMLWAIGGALMVPLRFSRPLAAAVFGGALALGALALLASSLWIELRSPRPPAHAATNATPAATDNATLVTTGTYALCRHPGVLWFGPFLFGLALLSGSLTLLWETPVWWALDFVYAWVQDRYIFPRQFPGYAGYQRTTPMFLPTRATLRRCLDTLTWRRG